MGWTALKLRCSSCEDVDLDNRFWIGGQTLAHVAVTFDQRRNVVRFARTTSDPILSPRHRHLGIFILRTPDGVVVTDILLGTPAAGLDIQLGDRVVAVDGQDVEKLSNAALWRLISGKDDLALILHRGDRRVEVRVSVIDLVP